MKAQDEVAKDIRAATDRFIAECVSVTRDQWLFRPENAAWSMSHVAEHVALSNDNLFRVLTKRLLESSVPAGGSDVIDVEIPYLFYRGDEPPNIAKPSGDWSDPRDASRSVKVSSDAIAEWASGATTDLRTVGLPHPLFGLLDGVQWLLFNAAHTERHRAQLLGLKHQASFPKRP